MLVPTPVQLDALREVANVGMGHAANALSRLVGDRTVRIDVPKVLVCDRFGVEALLGGAGARLAAGQLGLGGVLGGQLWLAFPEGDAARLCEVLLGVPVAQPWGEAERSALGEVANIVASACLTAISRLSGLLLLPTPPTVRLGEASVVLSPMFDSGGSAVVMEARFTTQVSPPFSGQLLIVPDAPSLGRLLSALGV